MSARRRTFTIAFAAFCSFLLSFFLVLGQYQVQKDGEDEYHGDAVFSEDGLDNLREDFEHLRCGCESEAGA